MKNFTTEEICKRILDKKRKVITNEHVEQVMTDTKNLPNDWSVNQRAWHYLFPEYTIPSCKVCNKPVMFLKKEYSKWCSRVCAGNDPEVQEKKLVTNEQKYGNRYVQQTEEFINKRKESLLEKYGVDCIMKVEEVKQPVIKMHNAETTAYVPSCVMCGSPARQLKRKFWDWCSNKCVGKDPRTLAKKRKTNLDRWGCEHPQRLDEFKKKQEQTMLARYGVRNAFQSEEIKEKIRATCMKKYGVTNPSYSPIIKQKLSRLALARFWPDVIEKRRITNIIIFGSSNNSNAHISAESQEKASSYEWMYDQYVTNKLPARRIGELLGSSENFVLTKLNKLGIPIQRNPASVGETELADFIEQYASIERHNRSIIGPKELDIVLHQQKLAFEYNGSYYHSENHNKRVEYHREKSNNASKAGFTLFHISDCDWELRRPAVESLILKLLGVTIPTPYNIDNFNVTVIDEHDAVAFFEKNYYTDFTLGDCYPAIIDNFGEVFAVASVRDGVVEHYCEKLNSVIENGLYIICMVLTMSYEVEVGIISNQNYPILEYLEKDQFEFLSDIGLDCKYYSNISSYKPVCPYTTLSAIKEDFNSDADFWNFAKDNGIFRVWDAGNSLYKPKF